MREKKLDPRDVAIGKALCTQRISCGKSQKDCADYLGISFQQFGKFENGENRLTVKNLIAITNFLKIDAGAFVNTIAQRTSNDIDEAQVALLDQLLLSGAPEMLALFAGMTVKQRKTVLTLFREIGRG